MKLIKINLFFLFILIAFLGYSQKVKKDSIVYKDIYGIRIGIDVANPIRTFFDNNRKSLELVADYRVTKKIYAAVELGFLNKLTNEDYINFTTNGQYFKIGANYNLYQNWLDMENETYIGLRYGFATFHQTLSSYSIYSDSTLATHTVNEEKTFNGLTANWAALVIGMKVETFKNVFLGASVSLNKMISTKEPENFKNLFVPGFDRVYLNDGGFSFNYTIAYRLPLYKKKKIKTEETTDNL